MQKGGKKKHLQPLGGNKYKDINELSYKARQRIQQYVTYLVDSAQKKRVYCATEKKWFSFRVNFVTLTLPSKQCHTDREIHNKCFKEFIRAWKRQEPNLLYIYKAETQANGNLHYHLTTNAFIHHRTLRNMWNLYVNKLGYVDRYKGSDPNSTDVHAVKNIRNLAAYMGKYLTKNDKTRRAPEMKLWDCSTPIKNVRPISMDAPSGDILNECRALHQIYGGTKKFDYCTIQAFTLDALRKDAPKLYAMYWDTLTELRAINAAANVDLMRV